MGDAYKKAGGRLLRDRFSLSGCFRSSALPIRGYSLRITPPKSLKEVILTQFVTLGRTCASDSPPENVRTGRRTLGLVKYVKSCPFLTGI